MVPVEGSYPGVTHAPPALSVTRFEYERKMLASRSPTPLIIPLSRRTSPCITSRPNSCPVQIVAFCISTGDVPGSKRSETPRAWKFGGGPGNVLILWHFCNISFALIGISVSREPPRHSRRAFIAVKETTARSTAESNERNGDAFLRAEDG